MPVAAAPAGGRRDPDCPVRNTQRDAMCIGNTPFAAKVWTRRVQQAITLAGPPPQYMRCGVSECACVSWYAKGICLEHYDHAADHAPMSTAEITEFHVWCAVAYT
jgi:hypothetical protein